MARPVETTTTGTEREDENAPPAVIELGDAATLTRGGSGSSTEDKRYQYG
ncbi:albusnodin family lasso peptide [Streptomyces sp. NPDC050560]